MPFLRQKARRSWNSIRSFVFPPQGLMAPCSSGEGRLGDDEIRVHLDDLPETPAGLAGTDRAVEGEEIRDRGPVGNAAPRAFESVAEGEVSIGPDPHVQTAAAEAKGLLQGIHDALSIRRLEQETVRDHLDLSVPASFPFLQESNLSVLEEAGESHPAEFQPNVFGSCRLCGKRKGDNDLRPLGKSLQFLPRMLRGFRDDGFPALPAVQDPGPGKEQFHVVGDLGHGSDSRAGRAHRVLAVDGDGRGDVLDALHLGPVHAVHELPGIGGEGLHVAPLALGVEGVEGEGRLARTAHAGDHRDLVQRDFKVQVLEVVLARADDADEAVFGRRGSVCHRSDVPWSVGLSLPRLRKGPRSCMEIHGQRTRDVATRKEPSAPAGGAPPESPNTEIRNPRQGERLNPMNHESRARLTPHAHMACGRRSGPPPWAGRPGFPRIDAGCPSRRTSPGVPPVSAKRQGCGVSRTWADRPCRFRK